MGKAADLFSLEGKVFLITGATNGIGLLMTEAIAEFGARQIIYVHRPSTDPAEFEKKIKAASKENGHDVILSPITADLATIKVSEIDEQIALKALALSKTGHIDVLINNAGIAHEKPFVEHEDDKFDLVLHVNLRVMAKLTQLIGTDMIKNNIHGKIICTCSLYSFHGGRDVASYTVSKGGVWSLVQALSNEWSEKGLQINGIVPGVIQTKMTKRIHENEEATKQFVSRIPAGHLGTPDDFKGVAVYLSSKASDYVTGSVITVDGGYRSW